VIGQVLEEGVVAGDRPGPDSAPGDGRTRVLVVLQDGLRSGRLEHCPVIVEGDVAAESGGHSWPALELHHQDGKAGAGGQTGQGCHHGRLSHAALAGHDQDPALAVESADVHDA